MKCLTPRIIGVTPSEFNGDTAIVVMAEKYDSKMEGKDVLVGENEYVTYLQDAEQLHNLLARLLNPARE